MDTTNKVIEYYIQGNSMASCSRKFKISQYLVKKILKENQIKIRNRSEQLVIENKKRAKPINHNYFSVLNQENSYYLGFIAADGTIRNNNRTNCNEIKIGLSAIDKNFLEEFKARIQSECKIREYITSNGFNCVSFTFSSEQIKQDLKKYSIVNNKTYLGITMKNIPSNFKLAFIKGYFDGDGSFSFNRNTKQGMIKFTSYTKGILEEINAFFNNTGKIYNKQNRCYSLEFSTLPSLKILEQFYLLETPCLKRKQQKYYDFLKLRNMNPRDKNSSSEDEKIC